MASWSNVMRLGFAFCVFCILQANSFLVVTIIALSWLVAIRTECQKAGIVFATMSKMCNFRQVVGKMYR